jgi:hypothetical protein
VSARPERRVDELAAGLRIQEIQDFCKENGCVRFHAFLYSQLTERLMIVVRELLLFELCAEPLVVPHIEIIQLAQHNHFTVHLRRFAQNLRN